MDKKVVRLLKGDCKDLFPKVNDNSVDLIVTDPPYGVEYSKGFDDSIEYVRENIRGWLSEMYRVLKDGCHCYVFIPTKQAGLWISLIEEIFTFNNILTVKAMTGATYMKNNFAYNSQLVVYCSKGTAKDFNKYDYFKTSESWLNSPKNKNPHPYSYSYPSLITECYVNGSTAKDMLGNRHPCAKNPELLKVFIGISSNPGDVVLDPFMGGGSTAISAVDMNRQFVGFELSEDYFEKVDTFISNAVVWKGMTVEHE